MIFVYIFLYYVFAFLTWLFIWFVDREMADFRAIMWAAGWPLFWTLLSIVFLLGITGNWESLNDR